MNLNSRNKKIGLVTVFEAERPFSMGTKATIEFFSDILIMEIQKKVETLHCYMKNGRSQAQTAKELHLHRSSLQYRLTKMEEVMGVQLDHYQTFLHLQMTYEMNKQGRT